MSVAPIAGLMACPKLNCRIVVSMGDPSVVLYSAFVPEAETPPERKPSLTGPAPLAPVIRIRFKRAENCSVVLGEAWARFDSLRGRGSQRGPYACLGTAFRVSHDGRLTASLAVAVALPASGNYFLGGAIVSFATFATRNLTTVFALILMASPVCGLRPSAGLALCLHQLADAGDGELAVLLRFLDGRISQQLRGKLLPACW